MEKNEIEKVLSAENVKDIIFHSIKSNLFLVGWKLVLAAKFIAICYFKNLLNL